MNSVAPEPLASGVLSRRAISRFLLAGLAIGALVWLARVAGDQLPVFAAWVEGLGFWGPAAFMLVYAAGVALWIPGSLLTLAAGAIFDLLPGTVYVFVAATSGSCVAFLVARYVARGAVERRLARSERFEAIDRAIGSQGFKIVFLLRLSPAFPFTPLNYLLGLSCVRFRDYLLASFGMLPATVLYVYYGKIAGDVAQLAGGAAPERGLAGWALLALGLAATCAVTLIVTRAARTALKDAIPE